MINFTKKCYENKIWSVIKYKKNPGLVIVSEKYLSVACLGKLGKLGLWLRNVFMSLTPVKLHCPIIDMNGARLLVRYPTPCPLLGLLQICLYANLFVMLVALPKAKEEPLPWIHKEMGFLAGPYTNPVDNTCMKRGTTAVLTSLCNRKARRDLGLHVPAKPRHLPRLSPPTGA